MGPNVGRRLDDIALGMHVLAEICAGLVLLFRPELFVPHPDGINHIEACRGIGNGAFSIGILGVCLMFSSAESRPWWGFAIMALYHLGVVVLQLLHPLLGVPYWLAPGFHSLLLFRFVYRAVNHRATSSRKRE